VSYRKAIAQYLQLLEQSPRDTRLLSKAGGLLQKAGEHRLAGEMYCRLAQCYRDDGFALKAAALFKQVLKLSPQHTGAREALASTLEQIGLHEEAAAQYQELLAVYRLTGAAEDAARTLETMIRLGMPGVDPSQKV
jgi:pilus assembly protein FimV